MKKQLDAKLLQLMREYAFDEAARASLVEDWYKEDIYRGYMALIDERLKAASQQTPRINPTIRQDAD